MTTFLKIRPDQISPEGAKMKLIWMSWSVNVVGGTATSYIISAPTKTVEVGALLLVRALSMLVAVSVPCNVLYWCWVYLKFPGLVSAVSSSTLPVLHCQSPDDVISYKQRILQLGALGGVWPAGKLWVNTLTSHLSPNTECIYWSGLQTADCRIRFRIGPKNRAAVLMDILTVRTTSSNGLKYIS